MPGLESCMATSRHIFCRQRYFDRISHMMRVAVYGRKLPRAASCGNFLNACYFGVTGELGGWILMGKKLRPSYLIANSSMLAARTL
jgi:hypothetical protein